MLGDLTPSKLASTILSALKCRCDILWLLLKEHSCYQSEVSSKSFCLKGLEEPLPPAEREVHEGFNIKIFDCQIDSRGESIDKRRDLLITPVSQVISRIQENSQSVTRIDLRTILKSINHGFKTSSRTPYHVCCSITVATENRKKARRHRSRKRSVYECSRRRKLPRRTKTI